MYIHLHREVMKRIWDNIWEWDNTPYDQFNRRQTQTIKHDATRYWAPFKTKESSKNKVSEWSFIGNERRDTARLTSNHSTRWTQARSNDADNTRWRG